jgi:signal transduction histidine kinase
MSGLSDLVRRSAAERIVRLQQVTSALSESLTPNQVADVVVHQGIATLGARAGSIMLLTDDRLSLLAAVGYPPEILEQWHSFPLSADIPIAESARTAELVLLESPAARVARYPHLPVTSGGHQAWAAIPLIVDGRVIGAMGLNFTAPHSIDEGDRAFMQALAHQCAQALDRARLYEAERSARAAAEAAQTRLAFLAEASTVLISSLDYDTTLANLARLVTPVLADWCLVDVVEPDGSMRRVAVAHADPAKRELVQQIAAYPPQHKEHNPIVQALRSRKPVVVREVTDDMLRAASTHEIGLEIVRALAPRAFLVLPLLARDHVLGAVSLVVSESGWWYGPADVALAEELARRAAIAIDNARLYSEARSAVRARDELLSIVSHDLQSPLSVIKGQANLLTRRLERGGAPDPSGVLEGLARIDAEVAKTSRLIGDLLDFARTQVGKAMVLERRTFDLVALARRLAAEHEQSTERHSIRVEGSAPALIGRWDPVRVERVLDNLLANAVKYSPRGGQIVVETASIEQDGRQWAVVAVHDHGLGIPAADLPRVFERFFRSENVARTIGGTGIGLTSARQIAELHGGSISVESQEGRESTFTLRLPLESRE